MSGLQPCPFCGSRNIREVRFPRGRFGCECDDCGAMTDPGAGSPAEAAAHWNCRREPRKPNVIAHLLGRKPA